MATDKDHKDHKSEPSSNTKQGLEFANEAVRYKMRKGQASDRLFQKEEIKYGLYKGKTWARLPNSFLLKLAKGDDLSLDTITARMVLEHRGISQDPVVARPSLHAIDRFSEKYLDRYIAYNEVEPMGLATFIGRLAVEALENCEATYDKSSESYTVKHNGIEWVLTKQPQPIDPFAIQSERYTIITII